MVICLLFLYNKERGERMKNKKTTVRSVVIYIIELLVIVIVSQLVFTKVIRPVSIIGSSMYPTVSDKDIALINVIGLKESHLERFDVVIIDWEKNNENIIKRLIGFPGDHIQYVNDELYINGVLYEEDYLDRDYVAQAKASRGVNQFTADFEYVVPEGKYFVLGDNRLNSADSRTIGCFNFSDFIGKEGIVIYPFNHFKWIK